MKTSGRLLWAGGVSVIGGILGVISISAIASGAADQASIASFNGGTIDLSQGWGSAQICEVTAAGTYCFANQSDYRVWTITNSTAGGVGDLSALASCSSGLGLYENVSYGGRELIITSRSNWINLSVYGFRDIVSSFKVGACFISMTDASNGSGNVYPGPTSPGSLVPWIGSAWNDRIQSVYIY